MFTGIVEEVGRVLAWRRDGADTLRVGASRVLADTRPGDSIAVDGACLTVAALGADWFEVGLIPETMQRTTLGRRAVGDDVNVEVDVIAKYVERLIESRLEQR